MNFLKPFEPIPFTQVLYNTLRECRPNFDASEYKWRLGAAVIGEFKRQFDSNLFIINETEKRTLYGIDVEIDYLNPYNIQLFEDITNKIAVEYKGDIKDE